MRNIENDCERCVENGDECSQQNIRYSIFWEATQCKSWRDASPNSGRFTDAELDDSHDVWAERQSDRYELWRNEY